MKKRNQTKWIIIVVSVLLVIATVVVFVVAGNKDDNTEETTQTTAVEETTKQQTTKPKPTEPTTVDSRGSTDSVKKMIALCFDDGPGTDSTKKLVTGLKERGAKATFFELGQMVSENPEMSKLIADSGCEIGIHGYDHSTFPSLGVDGTKKQISETAALIEKHTGQKPTHVRPPEGSYNDDIQKLLMDMGYDMIMWNVDTIDWKTRDASAVYNAVVSNGADGGDILCLHDIYDTTADGVLKAVDELMAKGYQFVTISELQAARDKFVPGRIWLSAHEFYDYGSKENVATASLSKTTAQSGSNGNSQSAKSGSGKTAGAKQDATDVEITWPSDS
ncbi:MAG: polysaccharide deacetylase family protein [Clostridia bacterium]|nr:polysaccharide deacetylase family protein [Clostridia bacterium]